MGLLLCCLPSKRVTLAGWEHENGAFWIAGSSYLASNHGSRCLLSLPSLPPCSLIEKRARLAFFFLTELAWPSKGAIEQVTGLDLFAWSTEQPWGNPCSPCVAPPYTAGGDIGDVNLKRSSVRFCLCAFFPHRSAEYRTLSLCMCETNSLVSIFSNQACVVGQLSRFSLSYLATLEPSLSVPLSPFFSLSFFLSCSFCLFFLFYAPLSIVLIIWDIWISMLWYF